jgi:hypothetical protein
MIPRWRNRLGPFWKRIPTRASATIASLGGWAFLTPRRFGSQPIGLLAMRGSRRSEACANVVIRVEPSWLSATSAKAASASGNIGESRANLGIDCFHVGGRQVR